jgi:hypothetical protein
MAFRTQKISQMTPKGADLEATDLIEVSTIESGSYVTRSITGQELIDAIPAPTGFVPTSRTLTINGVAQDLSADRSWTISTGLTIGTTPIASGTIGRVLFQGTGNVLQQSANLFWDSTNNRLGIGTSTPDTGLTIVSGNTFDAIKFKGASSSVSGYLATGGTSAFFSSGADATGSYVQVSSTEAIVNGASRLALYTAGTEKARIFSTGNFLINTTTDAGFKLDVNGTARVSGVFSVGSDTARIDLWRSSGAFGGRIGTGYSNPAVNHVYIQCDTNSKAILIDDSNRTLFSSSNGDTTTASAQVTINSSTRGFLPPRMTQTQRNAIASPAIGLEIYQTDATEGKYIYKSSGWTYIG